MDSNDRTHYTGDPARNRAAGETHSASAPDHRTGSEVHATRLRGRTRNPLTWVLPLLLLVLMIGGAMWLLNRDRSGVVENGAAVGTAGRGEAADLANLTPGANVNVSAAQIREVVGDRTFWIGEGSDRALVVIPEDSSGPGARETRERFTRGQQVAITGRVAPDGQLPGGLDEQDRRAVLEANGRVILARSVRQREQ